MTAQERIATIRQSLRVFYCGLASLIPVLGLFPAASALVGSWRLRHYRQTNPARRYVKIGLVLGIIGILLTAALASTIILPKLVGLDQGGSGC